MAAILFNLMKHFFKLAFVWSVLISVSAFAEELPDSYAVKPSVCKFLFENEETRVMEMTLQPGEEIPMHRHDWPHLVYVMEPGQMTSTGPDGSSRIAEARAGQVIWMDAKPHALKNSGATVVRALLTEIKNKK